MDEQKFNRIVTDLNEFEGVQEVHLLNEEGNIIFKSGEYSINDKESIKLLYSWKNKESAISYQNFRYAIIKNDEIQLAAKNNSADKGSIAGSITSEGDYLIVHIAKETDIILLEWTILVNKLAWG